MTWIKEGLIYCSDKYQTGYAQLPFIDAINDKTWRIYFSTRTKDIISYPFYIDVEAENPKNIIKIYDEPILELGEYGTFDDNGITISSIITVENKKYLYYIGWNKRVSVSYALNIGIAVSKDGGNTFKKLFNGPIIDRSKYDAIFSTAPCVIKDNNKFKMWYVSCLRWEIINGKTEPVYVIKYSESDNGIDWEINNQICIDSEYEGEALGRPWVIKEDGIYKMWFSSRGSVGYREKDGQHYMITYAESDNGTDWVRKPEKFNLKTSSQGWDSEMMEYCSVFSFSGKNYMLYNGNGFGKTGFGLATQYTNK